MTHGRRGSACASGDGSSRRGVSKEEEKVEGEEEEEAGNRWQREDYWCEVDVCTSSGSASCGRLAAFH